MSLADPADEQNQRLKKFLEFEKAQQAPPAPMPGTNPILDAMNAQQTSIPGFMQDLMHGSAMQGAQADIAAAKRRKFEEENSQSRLHPW